MHCFLQEAVVFNHPSDYHCVITDLLLTLGIINFTHFYIISHIFIKSVCFGILEKFAKDKNVISRVGGSS